MKKSKKHVRTLPVVLIGLLALGSAAAFAQRQLKLMGHRPEVKVVLTGMVEREAGRIPVEKAAGVKSGEILDWTIISANDIRITQFQRMVSARFLRNACSEVNRNQPR